MRKRVFLYGMMDSHWMQKDYPLLVDIISPLIPQTYIVDIWTPTWDWMTSGVILLVMGIVYSLIGYPLFARRNL